MIYLDPRHTRKGRRLKRRQPFFPMDFDFKEVTLEWIARWLRENGCTHPYEVEINIKPGEIEVLYTVRASPTEFTPWERSGARTFNAIPERDMVKTIAAVVGQAIKQETQK